MLKAKPICPFRDTVCVDKRCALWYVSEVTGDPGRCSIKMIANSLENIFKEMVHSSLTRE